MPSANEHNAAKAKARIKLAFEFERVRGGAREGRAEHRVKSVVICSGDQCHTARPGPTDKFANHFAKGVAVALFCTDDGGQVQEQVATGRIGETIDYLEERKTLGPEKKVLWWRRGNAKASGEVEKGPGALLRSYVSGQEACWTALLWVDRDHGTVVALRKEHIAASDIEFKVDGVTKDRAWVLGWLSEQGLLGDSGPVEAGARTSGVKQGPPTTKPSDPAEDPAPLVARPGHAIPQKATHHSLPQKYRFAVNDLTGLLALSDDGSRVVIVAEKAENSDGYPVLWIANLDTERRLDSWKELKGTEGATDPFFFAPGVVGFFRYGHLWALRLDGQENSPEVLEVAIQNPRGASAAAGRFLWANDQGQTLLAADIELIDMAPRLKNIETMYAVSPKDAYRAVLWPVAGDNRLPGAVTAYSSGAIREDPRDMFAVVRLDRYDRLSETRIQGLNAQYCGGHLLYAARTKSNDVATLRLDSPHGQRDTRIEAHADALSAQAAFAAARAAVRIAYVPAVVRKAQPRLILRHLRPGTENERSSDRWPEKLKVTGGFAVSPDQRRMTCVANTEKGTHLYIVDLDESGQPAGEPWPVCEYGSFVGWPVWSPDGRELMFIVKGRPDRGEELFVASLHHRSASPRRVADLAALGVNVVGSWSDDGTIVGIRYGASGTYESIRASIRVVRRESIDAGDAFQDVNLDEANEDVDYANASLSRDGRLLLYARQPRRHWWEVWAARIVWTSEGPVAQAPACIDGKGRKPAWIRGGDGGYGLVYRRGATAICVHLDEAGEVIPASRLDVTGVPWFGTRASEPQYGIICAKQDSPCIVAVERDPSFSDPTAFRNLIVADVNLA